MESCIGHHCQLQKTACSEQHEKDACQPFCTEIFAEHQSRLKVMQSVEAGKIILTNRVQQLLKSLD